MKHLRNILFGLSIAIPTLIVALGLSIVVIFLSQKHPWSFFTSVASIFLLVASWIQGHEYFADQDSMEAKKDVKGKIK